MPIPYFDFSSAREMHACERGYCCGFDAARCARKATVILRQLRHDTISLSLFSAADYSIILCHARYFRRCHAPPAASAMLPPPRQTPMKIALLSAAHREPEYAKCRILPPLMPIFFSFFDFISLFSIMLFDIGFDAAFISIA
jgi:hypothetical protein